MSRIILNDRVTIEPKEIQIQIRKRKDGGVRYVCNLPKGFMDRILLKMGRKKGIYVIDCIKLMIVDGKPFLKIDETKEMI